MSKKFNRKYKKTKSASQAASTRSMTDDSFNPDYTEISMDLKRIGMLAAIFFVVLVGLSFVL